MGTQARRLTVLYTRPVRRGKRQQELGSNVPRCCALGGIARFGAGWAAGEVELPPARLDGPALLAGEAPRRTRIAFSAVGDHQRIQHYHQRCGRGQGEHSSPRRGWRPCDAGGTHRLLPSAAIGPVRYDTGRGLPGPHRSVCAADR